MGGKTKLIVGENSLAVKHPELLEEWDYKKNKIDPERIYYGSTEKAWWKCKTCDREWPTKICKRTVDKSGCRSCSKAFKVGSSDSLAQSHPSLVKEWDFSKNKLVPSMVSKGSDKKIGWNCKHGHKWVATISSRVAGNGCPYCAGQKVNNENCLAKTHPELSQEWDYEKNKNNSPQTVSRGSCIRVWWKCKESHSWQTAVGIRTFQKTGCPYCSGRLFSPEKSLLLVKPALAKEWHLSKNGLLTPDKVSYNSKLKVWWICSKGHEWKTKISHRNSGSGCPRCKKLALEDGTTWDSKIEVFTYLWLKAHGVNVLFNKRYAADSSLGKRGKRYDFYAPAYNLYLEVTSFNAKTWGKHKWFHYLRGIVAKKRYVEGVLKARFVFISHSLSKEELSFVNKIIKKT